MIIGYDNNKTNDNINMYTKTNFFRFLEINIFILPKALQNFSVMYLSQSEFSKLKKL